MPGPTMGQNASTKYNRNGNVNDKYNVIYLSLVRCYFGCFEGFSPRCEVGELQSFNWHEHDGRNYGVQRIEDQKLGHELRTIFVKEDLRRLRASFHISKYNDIYIYMMTTYILITYLYVSENVWQVV